MIIELKTAKYKGVEFLFTDMSTTGGNRLIKYNFPGSDKQSIERQGKAPRSFTITAVIPHDDYFQQRDNLLRVLEDGASGVLTHPTFGDVENVKSGQYTLTEKLSNLGRAEVVIPFEVDDSPGIPQQSGNLASQASALNETLISQLETDLADSYEVSLSFSGNFSDAMSNLDSLADAMDTIVDGSDLNIDNVASFRQTVNNFRSNIGNLIQSPLTLSSEISGLFRDVNTLFSLPGSLYDAFSGLFNFGDDDPVTKNNTVGRQQRNNNRQALRSNIKTQALGYAYLSASESTYSNTDELDLVQESLEAQYLDIRNNQNLTNEAAEDLDRLRVQSQKILDQARVNTRSIITISTKRMPLSVLVYSYYGSTDLVETIAEINNINQNAFVEGDVRILTA